MSLLSKDKLHVQPPLHPHEKEKVPLFSSSSSSSTDLYDDEGEGHEFITEKIKGIGDGDDFIHQTLLPPGLASKKKIVTSRVPYTSSKSPPPLVSPSSSSAINNGSIEISTSMSSLLKYGNHNKKNNDESEESIDSLERKAGQRNPNEYNHPNSQPSKASISPQRERNSKKKKNEDAPSHDKNSNNRNNKYPTSAASLVVCGVDGTVYTLDAYSGKLRGMFASGSALVSSSASADVTGEFGREDDGNDADNQWANNDDRGDEFFSQEEFSDSDDKEHEEETKSHALLSRETQWKERVVPGLDGRLYSLFEMSDGADVDDATYDSGHEDNNECERDEYEETEDLDGNNNCHASRSSDDQESRETFSEPSQSSSTGVMPRFGTYNLTPLPISVMDVVDSPISTCRPIDAIDPITQEQKQQCGIVVGSKKTTIFALDPTTGKVRWTQDPHGGAGAKGWTTSNPTTAPKVKTVLLQREDYAVRHLDTDGGGEVWKVELGKFSALDFDIDAHQRGRGEEEEEGIMENDRGRHGVNARRRGAAAEAASLDNRERNHGVSPLLGGKRKRGPFHESRLFDDDSGFSGDDFEQHYSDNRKETLFPEDEFDFDNEHPHFRGFPSIAFGEDGTSIMAVDGMSGEMLWKRRIESVVAAVYGVGKESSWIPLDVIDESSIFTHDDYGSSPQNGHGTGLIPSASSTKSLAPSSGGLVPYDAGQYESGQLHRLGRYDKNLFVSSKFEDISLDSSSWSEPEIELTDLTFFEEQHELVNTPIRPQINDHGHGFAPSQASTFMTSPPEVDRPPSHKTEHGLFLTWPMVSAIVGALFAVVVFARFAFLRQKRKWENTPLLAPASASNSSEDGVTRAQSNPSGIILPPAFSTSGDPWWKEAMSVDKLNKPQPYFRSLSLSAMPSQPFNASARQTFMSEKNESNLPLPQLPVGASPPRSASAGEKTLLPAANATSASPTTASRSRALSMETPNDKTSILPATPNIDNIDGIPLIRYSRYRSEFTELSPLGKGGFGTVFRCTNALDSREYAIKKIWIKSQLGIDGKVTKHFSQKLHRVLREVKILAVLDHPNIVRYYTAWLEVDDGTTAFKSEDDESFTTSSLFDRKSSSVFSNSLFSGFGSNSRSIRNSFSPGRIHQRPATKALSYLTKGNPLGWNNFGSFRLDESDGESSSFDVTHDSKVSGADGSAAVKTRPASTEEDLGFTWERSDEDCSGNSEDDTKIADEDKKSLAIVEEESSDKDDSESESSLSSVDSFESGESNSSGITKTNKTNSIISSKPSNATDDETKVLTTEGRHILFIQMQLCSIRTLGDFLANRRARSGNIPPSSSATDYDVDIPLALRLFGQIVGGVKYVHKQGLIHRDLKPQNCFIDDAGNVKVGDFGLSRESHSPGGISAFDDDEIDDAGLSGDQMESIASSEVSNAFGGRAENTAGVGTRAYASPEQMRGSNYDASTDVYSLGIILFELCYPMYTAMERYQEFAKIRKGVFPTYWNDHVKKSFPTLHDLLVKMVSDTPSERPSAALVSELIDSLLGEYSVQSLDKSWAEKGALLLRVETEEAEGVLAKARKLINESAPGAKILQYGLRGQDSKAIIEFALETEEDAKNDTVDSISRILRENDMVVRRIAGK